MQLRCGCNTLQVWICRIYGNCGISWPWPTTCISAQRPLSRAIRALEGRLGVQLFARSRRRVELTAEGARLLGEARRLIGQLERSVQEVRGMARGEEGRLRIGFVSLADFGVLPQLLKTFKAGRPRVALALR